MPLEHDQPANSPVARIPVRSRRHAMDWSLVLVSQGIETSIEHPPESGWALVIRAGDLERARAAIHRYRVENLRWPWRQPVLQRRLVFDWASAVWVLLLVGFHGLAAAHPGLRDAGLMDTTRFADGQWWRIFTAVWLHADSAHLAANAVFGLLLLGLALGHYDTGIGSLAAYLAGALGNLADAIVYGGGHHSLGASGMVMGALGLLAAQSLPLRHRPPPQSRYVVGGIAAGALLFVFLGLAPEADVVAHAGGFVGGLVLGTVLSLLPRPAPRVYVELLAGLIFAVLVILPWELAMGGH